MKEEHKDPKSLEIYKQRSKQWRNEVLDSVESLDLTSLKALVNVLLVSYEMRQKRSNKIYVYKKSRLSLNDVMKKDKLDLEIFDRIFLKVFGIDLKKYADYFEIKEKILPEVLNQYKINSPETSNFVRKGVKLENRIKKTDEGGTQRI